MNISKNRTTLILMITLLWVIITLCGWTGNWFVGLNLSVIVMLLYMMLGSAKKGKLDKALFMYPLLSWAILWIVGFNFSNKYANVFAGKMPSFTILGFHPSFAFIVLAYWIGGVLTLTLGFNMYHNHWLSNEDWEEFKEKVRKIQVAKEES